MITITKLNKKNLSDLQQHSRQTPVDKGSKRRNKTSSQRAAHSGVKYSPEEELIIG